ncbi:hypothetical protein AX17_000088 [Amanita inopinata Kibby_2008]|nr:hypothetical protein AX17_000088 [Amanita inopinata Kibby_2008]
MFIHPALLALYVGALSFKALLHAGVSASPLPLPMVLMAPDYEKSWTSDSTLTSGKWLGDTYKVNKTESFITNRYADLSMIKGSESRRQDGDHLRQLSGIYYDASVNAKRFSELAERPTNTPDFHNDCIAALLGFKQSVGSFQAILSEIGADRGLAFYDRSDDLEKLVKNIINICKKVFSAVDILVDSNPTLGLLLGPIVYDIKCILDLSLDAVENLTDAVLDVLRPMFIDLLGQAGHTACRSGIDLLGICL